MSAVDLDATGVSKDLPARPRPSRSPARPARGRGRAGTPGLRPVVRLPAPPLSSVAAAQPSRACLAARPGAVRPRRATAQGRDGWRLTDRGIAVVLVAVAMVAVAALAVVLPTALRVTGDNYTPIGTSQLARP